MLPFHRPVRRHGARDHRHAAGRRGLVSGHVLEPLRELRAGREPGTSGTFVHATSQAAAFNVNTDGATFFGTLKNTGALTDIDIRIDGEGLSATYK